MRGEHGFTSIRNFTSVQIPWSSTQRRNDSGGQHAMTHLPGEVRPIVRQRLHRRRLFAALCGSAVLSAVGGRVDAHPSLSLSRQLRSPAALGTPTNSVITDLGTLPGWKSTAPADINAAGWIVGSVSNGGPGSAAFLWRDGVMTDLGRFPGTDQTGASAINDSGQVVGRVGRFRGIEPSLSVGIRQIHRSRGVAGNRAHRSYRDQRDR